MSTNFKRKDNSEENAAKRVKKECSYGESCFRLNPAHFRECSHPHLEKILDAHTEGDYPIPDKYHLQRQMFTDQLDVIVQKQLYVPKNKVEIKHESCSSQQKMSLNNSNDSKSSNKITKIDHPKTSCTATSSMSSPSTSSMSDQNNTLNVQNKNMKSLTDKKEYKSLVELVKELKKEECSVYRPILKPTKRIEDFLHVVLPKGKMAAKHKESAPYYIFYTAISKCKETHNQPYSITFQEILDPSLGELKASLQINFMVELGWLLAQYYFAGYSLKKLTILYGGDENPDVKNVTSKKPHVEIHRIHMSSAFGTHHTKMMILCYEDGSLRVVISTANLYLDDWENRSQGLWFSPRCPKLPMGSLPHMGDSPTMFKKSLLKYLYNYNLPLLAYYIDKVERCDFSHINVFLIASVPGSHFDTEWSLTRVGSLLRLHCCVPWEEQRKWPLVAQASSLGSFGKDPKVWLTGDFLYHFTKVKTQGVFLSSQPDLKLIYPTLENVTKSHDGLLGGGCLPYSAAVHMKQPWLNNVLHEWKATSTNRDHAMPHIKTYIRVSPDNKRAAYYLLTSANLSKAAWGTLNKGNGALRVNSYEAGVLFLPTFVINEDFFPLQGNKNRLIIPYDLPPSKYTEGMLPWVFDYLS